MIKTISMSLFTDDLLREKEQKWLLNLSITPRIDYWYACNTSRIDIDAFLSHFYTLVKSLSQEIGYLVAKNTVLEQFSWHSSIIKRTIQGLATFPKDGQIFWIFYSEISEIVNFFNHPLWIKISAFPTFFV